MLSVSGGNRTGDPGRFGQAPFAGERGLLVAVIYVNPLVVGGAQWLVDQELDSLGGRMVWRLLLVVLVNPRWVPMFKTNNKIDRPKKRALVMAPVRWGCRLAKKKKLPPKRTINSKISIKLPPGWFEGQGQTEADNGKEGRKQEGGAVAVQGRFKGPVGVQKRGAAL